MEISISYLLSYVLGIIEIFFGYCFLDLLTEKNLIKQNTAYVLFFSAVFGISYGYDRVLPNSTLLSNSIIIFYVLLIFISVAIKSSSKLLKFAVILIYFVIISYLKLLLAFVFSLYTKDILFVYHDLMYRNTIYGIVAAINFIAYMILKSLLKKQTNIDLCSFQYLFISYGVAGYLFIIVLQNRLLVLKTTRIFETLLFICILLISAALMIIGSIIYYKQREELVTLEIYNKMMTDRFHEIEQVYHEFAFVNHDIKNHLIVLGEYEEAGEHDKALAYLKKIQIPLSQNISRYIKTGNDTIDIILNFKLKEAEKNGISIDIDCEIITEWQIDDADLCSLLGNLLDNAINASSKMSTGDKWIKFTMQKKGNIILLQMSNSYLPSNDSSHKKNILHGYGLQSVKNTVKKYSGDICIVTQDNIYIVIINFNI